MFDNLEAELKRKKATRNELANALGLAVGSVSTKLNSKYDFTLREAFAIKGYLKVDMSIDELFMQDEQANELQTV